MKSHYEVIKGFKDGKSYKGANVFAEGNYLYSYGKHFILAVRKEDGSFLLNGDKYSVTTSRHQSNTYRLFGKHSRVSFSACESAMGDLYWYEKVEVLDHTQDEYKSFRDFGSLEEFKKTIPSGAEVHISRNSNGEIDYMAYHRIGQALLKYNKIIHLKYDNGMEEDRIVEKYFICGMDEGSYFVSELPKPAKTVEGAFKVLKPYSVQKAEKNGIEVKRQGEWFFIPQKKEDLPHHLVKNELKSHSLPHEVNSAAHIVTRMFKGMGRTFTKGYVRHSRKEHRPLNLGEQFHIAVKNTAIGNWSARGNVD
jgi:hypothetical protein